MAYGTQTTAPEPIAFTPVSARYGSERGSCPEATITLHDPASGVSEITICLAMPEGLDYFGLKAKRDSVAEYSPEWWRLAATGYGSSLREQGFFATVEDGKRLIEVARRTSAVPSVDELLAAAGFVYRHTVGNGRAVYGRNVGRHAFMLMVDAHSVWLTFQRDGAASHRNLLRLATQIEGQNDPIPCIWPSYLEGHAMHVLLACQMADDYEAAGRTASTRKSPTKRKAAQ